MNPRTRPSLLVAMALLVASPGASAQSRDPSEVGSWDPETDTWTTWASLSVFRGYHSLALLLPDGRILSAGGKGTIYYSMEVFSPPFRGPRPVITSAPESIDLDEPFSVESPNGGAVAKVSLIRLGSVTHAFDQNQRFVPLEFTQSAGVLAVRAPRSSNLAPPGHYMLFLVDAAGVPSVAKIVRLSNRVYAPAPPQPSITQPGQDSPPPGSTSGSFPEATQRASGSSGCTSAQGIHLVAGLGLGLWLSARIRRRRGPLP